MCQRHKQKEPLLNTFASANIAQMFLRVIPLIQPISVYKRQHNINMNNQYRELTVKETDINGYFYRNNYSSKEMKLSADLKNIILYSNKKGMMTNRQCIRLDNVVRFKVNRESEFRKEWYQMFIIFNDQRLELIMRLRSQYDDYVHLLTIVDTKYKEYNSLLEQIRLFCLR